MLTIAPLPLPAQLRQRGPDDGERAEEIGLHLGAEFGIGSFLDCADDAVAGIVDDNVDAAEAADRGRDRLLSIAGDGHIELVYEDTVRSFRGERVKLADRSGGGDDVVAAIERIARKRHAEAGRGAGDEPGGGDGGHDLLLPFWFAVQGGTGEE